MAGLRLIKEEWSLQERKETAWDANDIFSTYPNARREHGPASMEAQKRRTSKRYEFKAPKIKEN